MSEQLISVIVPVYNTEKYLDRCVESIVNQTFKNLEIILVDDGSPDSSAVICDEWAKRDDRIKVIHKENGGVSSARNAALDIAAGDYIAFVDSDDYVELNMYETLLSLALKYNADISRCSYRYEYNDNLPLNEAAADCSEVSKRVITAREYMSNWHQVGLSYSVCWNKLYKRELINDVRFNSEYKIGEDHLFNYDAVQKAKKIAELPLPFYIYFQNNESVLNSSNNLAGRVDNVKVHREIFFKEKDCADSPLSFSKMYCMALTDAFAYSVKYNLTLNREFAQIVSFLKNDYSDLMAKSLDIKEKAKLFLCRKFKVLYIGLLNLYFKLKG